MPRGISKRQFELLLVTEVSNFRAVQVGPSPGHSAQGRLQPALERLSSDLRSLTRQMTTQARLLLPGQFRHGRGCARVTNCMT